MADNKNASVANDKPKPNTSAKVRKRLNLDLSEEAYSLLQELAEAEDKNMAEVLRTGLALYGIAHEERQRGRSLGVVKDDRVIKEIVIT
ncbi:hypothetical protein [Myxacorys almedinensis]|uniref:Ribbon-helix-helix protein CopG domain-containing protein n=1 Tax=Myxacorys almedinensis A TaxID=2690445 RepID=A0A8J8CMG1_9CYAN|nr:hypothetical protein [Myxacorys almedinensis]NDJ18680.1 hypothetical protein [Myxacorys almedinensis A]